MQICSLACLFVMVDVAVVVVVVISQRCFVGCLISFASFSYTIIHTFSAVLHLVRCFFVAANGLWLVKVVFLVFLDHFWTGMYEKIAASRRFPFFHTNTAQKTHRKKTYAINNMRAGDTPIGSVNQCMRWCERECTHERTYVHQKHTPNNVGRFPSSTL